MLRPSFPCRVSRPLLAALLAAGLLWDAAPTPAAAEPRVCLGGAAAQEVVYAGRARRLSELRGAFDGELIRADLCRDGNGYVYIVTTLGANGKVSRRLVNANPAASPGANPAAAPSRPAIAQPMLAPAAPR